jgi:hypothetical protein
MLTRSQAIKNNHLRVFGYHPMNNADTERRISTLARSMFRGDIIDGGLAGSVHGSAFLKLNALQSGFQG